MSSVSALKGKVLHLALDYLVLTSIRVNVGGKLDVVCFDKTGTLTEDGLDVLGVRVVDTEQRTFGELVCNSHSLQASSTAGDTQLRRAVFNTMATCHSLRLVDDVLVGDPLDQKMFEFTGWIYCEGDPQTQVRAENAGTHGQEIQQFKFSPPIVRPPVGSPVLSHIQTNV